MGNPQHQEAKYAVPYHYSLDRTTVQGVLYMSYMKRAEAIVRALNPQRAVDVGCGDARFIALLKDVNIEGLDYSDQALQFARVYNPQTTFTVADVRKAPYADATFDVVTMIEVIEHIKPEEVVSVLQGIRRILKPNGRLIITTPTVREHKMSRAHYQHFTKESMESYLRDAGFSLERMEGNFKKSPFQMFVQGLMANRFFEIKSKFLFGLYRKLFDSLWDNCDIQKARRMIVVAQPS